jgi:hypothetical protein
VDNSKSKLNLRNEGGYLRMAMHKPTLAKGRPRSVKKRVVRRKPKPKVFDGWHLFGAAPGITDEALAELKRMRNEW